MKQFLIKCQKCFFSEYPKMERILNLPKNISKIDLNKEFPIKAIEMNN